MMRNHRPSRGSRREGRLLAAARTPRGRSGEHLECGFPGFERRHFEARGRRASRENGFREGPEHVRSCGGGPGVPGQASPSPVLRGVGRVWGPGGATREAEGEVALVGGQRAEDGVAIGPMYPGGELTSEADELRSPSRVAPCADVGVEEGADLREAVGSGEGVVDEASFIV